MLVNKIASKFLIVHIEDDEGEGFLHALVFKDSDGTIQVVEPNDVWTDPCDSGIYAERISTMERCLSNRERYRLYSNLQILFQWMPAGMMETFLTFKICKEKLTSKDRIPYADFHFAESDDTSDPNEENSDPDNTDSPNLDDEDEFESPFKS